MILTAAGIFEIITAIAQFQTCVITVAWFITQVLYDRVYGSFLYDTRGIAAWTTQFRLTTTATLYTYRNRNDKHEQNLCEHHSALGSFEIFAIKDTTAQPKRSLSYETRAFCGEQSNRLGPVQRATSDEQVNSYIRKAFCSCSFPGGEFLAAVVGRSRVVFVCATADAGDGGSRSHFTRVVHGGCGLTHASKSTRRYRF